MTCVSIAVTAVLAIVAVQNDIDFLSTLALALAVLAFVIQIIVFIAQSASGSQQVARAEELHGLTTRALAAIEEKSEGTRQTVNVMSERMFDVAVGKVRPEAKAAGMRLDSREVRREIEDLLRAAQAPSQLSPVPTASAPLPLAQRRPVVERRGAKLPIPNETEVDELVEVLGRLDDGELIELNSFGLDYERYGGAKESQTGHGYSYMSDAVKFYELGLAKKTVASWSDEIIYVLTDRGRKAAALLRSDRLPTTILRKARDARRRLQEGQAAADERITSDPANLIPIESVDSSGDGG